MSAAKPKERGGKESKVQLRLRPDQKKVIHRAARLRQTTLSQFVLEQAYQAAQQVLADEVHFVVPEARWEAFCRALDEPPRVVPALRDLFARESPFDDSGPSPS